MAVGRTNFRGIYLRGKLYAVGGDTGSDSPISACEAYDIASNAWSSIASLPTRVSDYSAVSWRDSVLFLMGGRIAMDTATNRVWIYSPSSDTWIAGDTMLAPCYGGDACVIGDTICIAGDYYFDDSMRIGAIDPSNPAHIVWSWGPQLPSPRPEGPTVALRSRVFWFGGSIGTDKGYVYNPRSREISPLPDYPKVVDDGCGVARESTGELYGLGGDQSNGIEFCDYYKMYAPGIWDVGATDIVEPPADTDVDSGATIVPAAVVANFGEYPEGFRVMFRIDSTYVHYDSVFLQPGESATVSFPSWLASSPGRHAARCSTMLALDNQRGNDEMIDSFTVWTFDAGITGWTLPDTLPAGGFNPVAMVHNYGQVAGELAVHWWILSGDRLSVYNQAESAYLSVGASKQLWFPAWNAVIGDYDAKIFAMHAGSVYHDTVQLHFVVVPDGIGGNNTEPLPTEFSVAIASPNPSRDAVTIRYALPKTSALTLRVYDATGQVVRTLVDSKQKAGRYSVVWNREDDQGCRLSAGLYFVRLSSSGIKRTTKVVIAQ
jgi:hypothetical protein